MKFLFLLLVITVTQNAFAIEAVSEFWEVYRAKSCRDAKAQAEARVQEQLKKGDDLYDGSVTQYRGKKILRFILSEQNCVVLWSNGHLYDYSLRIEVAQGS